MPDIYCSDGHLLQCRTFTAVQGIYCSDGHLLQCRTFTAVPGIYCSTGHLLQCRTFTAVPDIYYSAGHLLQCRAFTAVPGIYCSAGHLLQCRAFTAVMDIYCSAGHLLQCPSSNRYAKCLVIGNHHWKSTSDMTLLFASELFLLRMTVALSNLPAVQAPTFLLHSICLSVCLKWRLISTFFENVNALSLSLSLSLSSGYRVFVSNWFRTTASRKFSHLSRLASCLCFSPCPLLLLVTLGSSLTQFKPKSQCPYLFIKGIQCYRQVRFAFNIYSAFDI